MADQESRDDALKGLMALNYHERMTRFIRHSTRHLSHGTTVLDFRPLYAVSIHHIHRQLAQEISEISKQEATDEKLNTICQLVKKYTNALRDFEYIHANRWQTDFVKDIAASRIDNGPGSTFQAALLNDLGLALNEQQYLLYTDEDILNSFNSHLKAHVPTRGTKRRVWVAAIEKQKQLRIKLLRLSFAVLGGSAIIVPMLLMAKSTVPTKMLLTIGISIAVFAIVMALFSSSAPENLLAATAAYAAVLVAFLSS